MDMYTVIRLYGHDEKVFFIVNDDVATWIQNEDEEVPDSVIERLESSDEDNLPDFVLEGESFTDHIWSGEDIEGDKANAIISLYESFNATSEMMNYVADNNIIIDGEWQGYLH